MTAKTLAMTKARTLQRALRVADSTLAAGCKDEAAAAYTRCAALAATIESACVNAAAEVVK